MKFFWKLSHKNAIKTENRVKTHWKSGHIVAIFVKEIGHSGHGFQKIWPYLIFNSWEHCQSTRQLTQFQNKNTRNSRILTKIGFKKWKLEIMVNCNDCEFETRHDFSLWNHFWRSHSNCYSCDMIFQFSLLESNLR